MATPQTFAKAADAKSIDVGTPPSALPDGEDHSVKSGIRSAAEAPMPAPDGLARMADSGPAAAGSPMRPDAAAPASGAGYSQGQQAIESWRQISQVFHATAQTTTEDMQALNACYAQVRHGLQHMQTAYMDMLRQALDGAKRQPQEILRCRSAMDFATMQRTMYLDAVDFMLKSTATMLAVTRDVTQQAMDPLETRLRQKQ